MRSFKRHPHRRQGFALPDAVLGLTMIVALTGLVTTTTLRQQKTLDHLANQRAAMRLAETTLLTLQAAPGSAPAPGSTYTLQIEPLEGATDATPTGYQWVRVTTAYGHAQASLLGLIPGAPGDAP